MGFEPERPKQPGAAKPKGSDSRCILTSRIIYSVNDPRRVQKNGQNFSQQALTRGHSAVPRIILHTREPLGTGGGHHDEAGTREGIEQL